MIIQDLITNLITKVSSSDKEGINTFADKIKKELCCESVFVNTTYSTARFFPIFNDAQKKFIKLIFEDGEYSRFDELIIRTLLSKNNNLEDLKNIYFNMFDD